MGKRNKNRQQQQQQVLNRDSFFNHTYRVHVYQDIPGSKPKPIFSRGKLSWNTAFACAKAWEAKKNHYIFVWREKNPLKIYTTLEGFCYEKFEIVV